MKREERSREADFKRLEDTSASLIHVLRADESKRDLAQQFSCQEPLRNRYFLNPYKRQQNEWGPMVSSIYLMSV